MMSLERSNYTKRHITMACTPNKLTTVLLCQCVHSIGQAPLMKAVTTAITQLQFLVKPQQLDIQVRGHLGMLSDTNTDTMFKEQKALPQILVEPITSTTTTSMIKCHIMAILSKLRKIEV